ncbi:FAD binding domain-containing protein [Coniochaeta sp. PMI_546]|nr:FAD binding domain-containing protein [Coniochaeta sp. PMI_546]
MSSLVRTAVAVLAAVAPFASAQTLVVDNSTVITTDETVAPAAETVPETATDASLPYFTAETVQLTDDVLANLTALSLSNISLFNFPEANVTATKRGVSNGCKTFPGDLLWPIPIVWTVFDLLLGGALDQVTPLAAPCYNDHPQVRNAAKCSFISANWNNDSYMHADDPSSVMWPLYQGRTCMPTTNPSSSCTLGGFPSYVVKATNVAQIQLAVNFARNANIRLVVKNTGHDFNGKSAGAGALSIWTHNLKDLKYVPNYQQGSYKGPAVKAGSGVQAFELYDYANKNGITVVGGEGKSVGVTGGYLLGGGHSPLSSLYGMAADQVLSMEVVTPDGRFVTASETVNPDLFWALRGGGGSTFGVLTSVTIKAYPKMPAAVATFSFSTGPGVTEAAFWAGVRAYFDYFITYTDKGTYEYFQIISLGPGAYLFGMAPFFAPNMTTTQLQGLIAPWLKTLSDLGIQVTPQYFGYNNFYDAWNNHFPLEAVGSTNIKTASRLFPKSNWADQKTLNATFDAIKSVVVDGSTVLAFNIAAAKNSGSNNAVNPAWRNTCLHAIQGVFWDEAADVPTIVAASKKMTFDWMQRWRDVSPGAGAYMSEADILEPNFQQAFYGSNYARLYQLKQKFDPFGLFYAPTGVGSEDWVVQGQVDGLPTQNGRLCRA